MNIPLVSFCITSYNQRQYIVQAIKAALNQDYQNLEILIADDCSTDGSVELIYDLIKGTRRRVSFLTSKKNLGIAKNYERMFSAAKGSLLVCADGDDVSHADRVSKLVEAWVKDGEKSTLITSDALEVDPYGRRIGIARGLMRGAVMAFSGEALRPFGRISIDGAAQDHIYANRCLMMGSRLHVNEALVTYRVGTGVSSVWRDRREPNKRMARIRVNGYRQLLLDLEAVRSQIGSDRYQSLRRQYLDAMHFQESRCRMISGRTMRERYDGWRSCFPRLSRGMALNAVWLLPPCAGDLLFAIDLRIKRLLKGSLS